MMMLKCKMCGGDVVADAVLSYGTCGHCGSVMTLPRVSDERQANLFNRANHFRRLNEFDKAMAAYESILNEDNTDAEAHWGVVLSRYGIEYVEDPRTHERIPTCHRVQADSILRDADYLLVLEHAPDSGAKAVYQRQAEEIAEIQKGILALSAREEPFDVFICYKETSDGGSRTVDSVLGQDLYHQLTREKYRVFFSRITLENRLGQAYEPYIFAAINSAKVMVVLGTKPEHFTAVWVKNEWSRFLSLCRKDRGKLLIPCYRDMEPYSLPEELSALQSQDMGKIGFLQDLVRGIKKTLEAEQPAAVAAMGGTSGGEVAALLKRAWIFLEDGEWDSADQYAERTLDKDPECAEGYLVKLMAQRKLKTEEQLGSGAEPLTAYSLYQKACRFSQGARKERLEGYNRQRLARGERLQREKLEHEEREQREREHQVRLLASAWAQLELGDFHSAAEILESMDGSLDVGDVEDRLSKLREEWNILAEEANSMWASLEKRGAEVARFNFNPWRLLARCRLAEQEASRIIGRCRNYLEKYPGSAARFRSSIENLQWKLDEFKAGALARINRRMRVCSLVCASLIIIVCLVVMLSVKAQANAAARVAKAQAEESARVAEEDRKAKEVVRVEEAARVEKERIAAYEKTVKVLGNPSRGKPFINSLGMEFVPVPGTGVLFCRWETRVKDYAAFATATGREVKKPSFAQTGDHPVVNVWWEDAKAFCVWLGRKDGLEYRLPVDAEWTVAVGLPKENGDTPHEKDGKIEGYPWGNAWPPPKGAGNYGSSLGVDGFESTSPVGSFAANGLGIYDLGGNACEWCEDWYDTKKSFRVLRGASWFDYVSLNLRSSYRSYGISGERSDDRGFRVVLVVSGR